MNIFLDMDLTVAKFPVKHGEMGTQKFRTEKGFFQKLEPYKNIDIVEQAIRESANNIFILSNSPTEQADHDKNLWLDKFLPSIKQENRIFNRGGLTAQFEKSYIAEQFLGRKLTQNDVLIDDSLHNLLQWSSAGGIAIFKKNRNASIEWNGKKVSRMSTLAKIIK